MIYLILFLEGVATFISPCLLPMLPIYISYFAGGEKDTKNIKVLKNALGFVTGFTIIFVTLGAFAGTLGAFLKRNAQGVNLVGGIIMIVFGLNYIGAVKIPFLNKTKKLNLPIDPKGFISSVLFGMIFSAGWTPCVGAFLGSALMLAASGKSSTQGIIMLLCYSFGLGIPFVGSALIINSFKTAFDFLKKNYRVINMISGGLLIILGILMAAGLLGKFLSVLSI